MRKFFVSILICASLFASFGSSAASRIEDGTVTIDATVPQGQEGGGGCTSNCGTTPTISIANVSAVATCNTAVISWQAVVNGTPTASTGTVAYWPQTNPASVISINITDAQINQSSNIASLNPLVTYDFSITARAQGVSTVYSGSSFTTNCAIATPTAVARSSNKQAVVDVTYPNSNDIAGVVIYRGQVSSCPSTNQVAYQDATTHLANSSQTATVENPSLLNQLNGYSVCIFNNQGVYSAPAYTETQRSIPEVVGANSVPGDAQVSVSWSLPNASSAIDFQSPTARVIRVTSGDCAAASTGDGVLLSDNATSNYLDTGLQNDQLYQYKIFTKNSYGEYARGVCVSATPSVVAVSRCLTNTSATSNIGSVTLNWQNPGNESGFTFNRAVWRRGGSCSPNFQVGTLVYQGQDQSFMDSSVLDQLYYYSGFVQYNNNQTIDCGCVAASPSVAQIEEPIDLCPECVVGGAGDGGLSPKFFVNKGGLEILPRNDQLDILPGYELDVMLSAAQLTKTPRLVAIQQGRQNYFLTQSPSQNVFETRFTVPTQPGKYQLKFSVVYEDDTVVEHEWVLQVLPFGSVTQNGAAVENADVTLLQGDAFSGYGIINPQSTSAAGAYGFMAPNGRYTIQVNGTGGLAQKKVVTVDNYVINENIILNPTVIEVSLETLAPVVTAVNKIIDNPTVEKATEQVAAPAAFIASSVVTLSAVPWWNFIYYLQSLFTEPLLWLTRRKRHGWGVVYNSITKQPIDLAVVRLYDSATKRIIQSRVSDRYGRFNFLVAGGSYYLDVSKPGFFFPSQLLKNVTEDHQFNNLYYGKPLVIAKGEKGVIVVNIPLDQEAVSLSDKQILRKHHYQWIRRQTSFIGPVFSLIAFAVTPGLITGAILSAHLIVFLLFKRLSQKKSPKSWGVVYDKKTKKPLSQAITRIFSPEYNRMLEAYVTDRYGRYGFFAGNNMYYVTADKDGYAQSKTDTITVQNQNAESIVGHDLGLDPANDTPQNSVTPATPITVESVPVLASVESVKPPTVNPTQAEAHVVAAPSSLPMTAADSVASSQSTDNSVADSQKNTAPGSVQYQAVKGKEDIFG